MALFRSPAALLTAWRRFCDGIVADGYVAAPTDTAFIRALATEHECDEAKITRAVARHLPAVRDAVDSIRADVITQGALAGRYPATVSTFVLKNKCGWMDKPEHAAPVSTSVAEIAAAIERMITDG